MHPVGVQRDRRQCPGVSLADSLNTPATNEKPFGLSRHAIDPADRDRRAHSAPLAIRNSSFAPASTHFSFARSLAADSISDGPPASIFSPAPLSLALFIVVAGATAVTSSPLVTTTPPLRSIVIMNRDA